MEEKSVERGRVLLVRPGFVPRKKRRIIWVVRCQSVSVETASLCCYFCWVLPQQSIRFLGGSKGLPLCVVSSITFIEESNVCVAFHFVTT